MYCRQRFGKSMVQWNLIKLNSRGPAQKVILKGVLKKKFKVYVLYTPLHANTQNQRLERRVYTLSNLKLLSLPPPSLPLPLLLGLSLPEALTYNYGLSKWRP